jgi:hypothetical protein
VEASEDAGFLRSIGCEFAQGFYYGELMSEREVLQLLKVIRKSERKLRRRRLFRTKVTAKKDDGGAGADASTTIRKDQASQSSRAMSGADSSLAGHASTSNRPQGDSSNRTSETQGRKEAGAKLQASSQVPVGAVRSRARTRVMSPKPAPTPPPVPLAPPLPSLRPSEPSRSADAPLPPAGPPRVTTGGSALRSLRALSAWARAGSAGIQASACPLPSAATAPLASAPQRMPPASEAPALMTRSPRSTPPPLPGSTTEGAPPTAQRAPEPIPNLAALPPTIAASLARLAGIPGAVTSATQAAGVATTPGTEAAAPEYVASKPPPPPTSGGQ